MARGNQREKAREANLKKMAAQVKPFPDRDVVTELEQLIRDRTSTEEGKPTERHGAAACQGGGSGEDAGEAEAR